MKSEARPDLILVVGNWCLARIVLLFRISGIITQALRQSLFSPVLRNPAVRSVLMRQIYFTGFEAWKIIVIIALILGTVIISQVVGLVGGGNGSLPGKVLVWVVFRELAPLITALIVIARSGTAIATELGSMKINGEMESLDLMGIDSERYLILPRITGVAASVMILTAYFVLTAFVGSFLISSIGFWQIPYDQFLQGIAASLGIREVFILTLKTIFFGLVIPSICCHYGLSVGTSATEIPQAATKAVITSIFSVFILDGVITFAVTLVSSI